MQSAEISGLESPEKDIETSNFIAPISLKGVGRKCFLNAYTSHLVNLLASNAPERLSNEWHFLEKSFVVTFQAEEHQLSLRTQIATPDRQGI